MAAFTLLNYVGLSAQETLTNQTVIAMKNAGLSEDLITTKVETVHAAFDLSTNGILELKKAGFSDDIIQVMMHRMKEDKDEKTDNDSASNILTSIQNNGDQLLLNGSKTISKGGEIQINLPAGGQDFIFVKPKTSGFQAKTIGRLADAAGGVAGVVGMSSGNLKTVVGATNVMRKAAAVSYGADALSRIQELPISSQAKKIAGRKAIVNGWKMTDDGYILYISIENKKYEANLQEALMAGEIKLN